MSTRLRWRRLSPTRYPPPPPPNHARHLPLLHLFQGLVLSVVCDSLADGPNRHPRPDDEKTCKCKEGWTGINCNLCVIDDACAPLMPQGINGTCYKGGLTVKQNFQMCKVLNRKIIDQLDPQVAEVTFSCHKEEATCNFQCETFSSLGRG